MGEKRGLLFFRLSNQFVHSDSNTRRMTFRLLDARPLFCVLVTILLSVTDGLLILNLRQKNDDEDDGESPGGEEPKDGELPPDCGVVPHYGEHVEPLDRDTQHRKKPCDDSNHKESIEELEMVTGLLDDSGN